MIEYLKNTFLAGDLGSYFCWGISIALVTFTVWLIFIALAKNTISINRLRKALKPQLHEDDPAARSAAILSVDHTSTTWDNFKNSLIEAEVDSGIILQRTLPSSSLINPEFVNPTLFKGYFLTWLPSVLTTFGVLGTFAGLQIGLQGLDFGESVKTLAPHAESGPIDPKKANSESNRVTPPPSNSSANEDSDEPESKTNSEADKTNSTEEASEKIKQMLKGITILIDGAKTAFNTSIFGVTAGILFGVFLRIGRQTKANNILKLSTLLDQLIPEVSPEDDLRQLRLSADITSEHIKSLTEKIGPKLQETLVAMPTLIGAAIGDEIRDAVGSMGDQNAHALGGALKDVYNEHLGDLSGLALAIQGQAEVTDSILKQLKGLPDKLESTGKYLETGAVALESTSSQFGEWDNALKNYAEKMETSASKFDEAAMSLDSAAATIDGAIPNLESAVGEVANTSKSNQAKLDEDTNKLIGAFANISSTMGNFKSTSEGLQELAGSLSKTGQRFEGFVAALGNAQESQEKSSLNNKLASTNFEKVSVHFEKTAEHLGELGDVAANLKAAGNAASTGFTNLEGTMERLEQLSVNFEGISNTFQEVTNNEIGEKFLQATESLDSASEKLRTLEPASSALTEASTTAQQLFSQAREDHELYIKGLTVGVKGLASELEILLETYRTDLNTHTQERIKDWNTAATNFGVQFTAKASDLHAAIEDLQDTLDK